MTSIESAEPAARANGCAVAQPQHVKPRGGQNVNAYDYSKEITSRITGVSIPVFGVSWNPPEPEREKIRKTSIFLEDRRALYNDYAHELDHEVSEAALAIRVELTDALKRLPEGSEATPSLKSMRAACREYLDNARSGRKQSGGPPSFMTKLGRFCAMIGVQVANLAVKYGIDVDGELVRVVPAEHRNATFLEA